MKKSILSLAALILIVLPGCDGFRNEAEARQCRANMNTLSTEQAQFFSAHDRWASTTAELDEMAGRAVPLVCPSCNEEYELTIENGEYLISCPEGRHGSIQTGRVSWNEPRVST